jgi:hypothetical protein
MCEKVDLLTALEVFLWTVVPFGAVVTLIVYIAWRMTNKKRSP